MSVAEKIKSEIARLHDLANANLANPNTYAKGIAAETAINRGELALINGGEDLMAEALAELEAIS